MSAVTERQILDALGRIADPDKGSDIVSLGMVSGLVRAGPARCRCRGCRPRGRRRADRCPMGHRPDFSRTWTLNLSAVSSQRLRLGPPSTRGLRGPDRDGGRVLSSRAAGPKSRIPGGYHGPVT